MLKTYFEEADAEAAATVIKELKPPKKYLNELVAYVMLESLDKGDNDRDNISKLISAMKKEGVITGEHFMEVSTVKVILQDRFQLRAKTAVKDMLSGDGRCPSLASRNLDMLIIA